MKTIPIVFAVVIVCGLIGLYLDYTTATRYEELKKEHVAEMEKYVALQHEYSSLQREHISLLEAYTTSEGERERLNSVIKANCFFQPEQAVSLGEAYSETVPPAEPYVE